MLAAFIITFREALEVALIIGIILSYLLRTKRQQYNTVVYLGIASAIVASIAFAIAFEILIGEFSGVTEEIFEGTLMFIAAGLLTYMIFWMLRRRNVAQEFEQKMDENIGRKGLFLLAFFSVLREGVETVIFLAAAATAFGDLFGALFGIVAALIIGYAVYVLGKRVNIKRFFNVTSIFLILFAAGLVAHGVHEFQEAGVIPILNEHVWDLNPAVIDEQYPLLHENGAIGGLFAGLFGYNGNPSGLEMVAYVLYLFLVLVLYANREKL